jgi:polyribonucleotide nucleotidyltransferase
MFKIFRKELDWGGSRLVLETGKVARQADGAVMVSLGETTVLCTAVAAQTAKPGQDFFPLTVNYQEKAFAAGKIPGGFFKREGRPSLNVRHRSFVPFWHMTWKITQISRP